ncbi:Embryogenesis-like protein [Linum grandiflorum]
MHRRTHPSLWRSLLRFSSQSRQKSLPSSRDSIQPVHGFIKLLPQTIVRNFHLVPNAAAENLQTTESFRRGQGGIRRWSSEPELDVDREVDMINLKFAEAREELETAMDAKETVYFDEEAECARDAANEVLSMYDTLLGKLPETKKGVVQRSMGLKMEQLKAEVKQLED